MIQLLKKFFTKKIKEKNPWQGQWISDSNGHFIEGDLAAYVRYEQREFFRKIMNNR